MPIARMSRQILALSLREAHDGGALLNEVNATPRSSPSASELLVLIHGYNNSQSEAVAAYDACARRQRSRLSVDSSKARFDALLADVFWPGDAEWLGALDNLDFLYYASAVRIAKEAAPRLASYLASRPGLLIVHFLAHSLGCRIALETIRCLNADPGRALKIGKVCLMAAAIPTSQVLPGGRLYDSLVEAEFVRVLFSPADKVLRLAFPAGQTKAGEGEGVLPVAIGLHGQIPALPGKIDAEHIVGAAHSDYWGIHDNQPSLLAENAISVFFGLVGGFRTLRSRPGTPSRPAIPSRRVEAREPAPLYRH
jgi:hypothetical protein